MSANKISFDIQMLCPYSRFCVCYRDTDTSTFSLGMPKNPHGSGPLERMNSKKIIGNLIQFCEFFSSGVARHFLSQCLVSKIIGIITISFITRILSFVGLVLLGEHLTCFIIYESL